MRFGIAGLWLGLLFGCAPASAPAGMARVLVITDTTPLSGNAALLRRSLTPLAQQQVAAALTARSQTLAAQAIDPRREHFLLYQPGAMPAGGYGLIVFISPADDMLIPPGWTRVLDRRGIMFVTAAGSGNGANVIGRREPLALIAEQAVTRRFQVDTHRIWVAGFSGGSRVAMRLALAFPDVFSGAILNAGSDPIGDGGIPLPPEALAAQFRSTTRLVYVTGEWDSAHLEEDATSQASMHDHCVRHVQRLTLPWTGHALMEGAALDQAIRMLQDTRAEAGAEPACGGVGAGAIISRRAGA